ncbi:MAG: hypothetical protein MZU84_05865 [Sphingobacterium sp.]|nr:hypothetical protein [Sphingobacterium sp.]
MPFPRHRTISRPALAALAAGLILALTVPLLAQEPAKSSTSAASSRRPRRSTASSTTPAGRPSKPVSGFFQYDPVNGAKASEETFVWAAYDQNYLYFAFLMKDSQPGKIWAELTPRNEWDEQRLDRAHPGRLQRQADEHHLRSQSPGRPEELGRDDLEVRGAVVRQDGWSAEMAIPFKSLRFSAKKLDVWGVNFERYIHRLNETDYWTDVDRDLPRLQQSGELCGLSGLKPGYNLEFFPYAGVRTIQAGGRDRHARPRSASTPSGASSPTSTSTSRPARTSARSSPIPSSTSSPRMRTTSNENRPFFTEGRQLFQPVPGGRIPRRRDRACSTPGASATPLRGQGLRQDGRLRVRHPRRHQQGGGRPGRGPPDSYFGVFRVQKDIFKNSQVGVYYAGVHDGEVRNQNVALDFSFNFKDFYYLRGLAREDLQRGARPVPATASTSSASSGSRTPGCRSCPVSSASRTTSTSRTGYVDQQRRPVLRPHGRLRLALRPGPVQALQLRPRREPSVRIPTATPRARTPEVFFWSELFNLIEVHGGFDFGRSKYQVRRRPTASSPGRPTTSRPTAATSTSAGSAAVSSRRSALEGGWEKRGVYNEDWTAVVPGTQTSVEGQLVLRPRSNLEWSIEGGWIRQTVDGTGAEAFNGLAYETALHYQLTRSLFLNTRFLGETRDNQYSLDFLVGYYFGAGNIVQLAFKKSDRNDLLGRVGGYSVTLKVSYLLRI